MNRSELTSLLSGKFVDIPINTLDACVRSVFDSMVTALVNKERIEIRGFGCFTLKYREPRTARNPKTGDTVQIEGKYILRFKPGKEMKERVNNQAGS